MNEQDNEAFEKAMEKLYNQPPSELWQAALAYERENNSPNEAYIKMLQDTVESQKKQIEQLEEQSSWLVKRMDWDNLTREETDKMIVLYRKYFPDDFLRKTE
jgi:phosphoribosyl-dephospho-CoA transferase